MRIARSAAVLVVSALALPPARSSPARREPPPAAPTPPPAPPPPRTLAAGGQWMKKAEAGKDLYATFKTSKGTIVVKLFCKDAPKTVANFVGLATGREGVDRPARRPAKRTRRSTTAPIFHRVIPNFMIQGGDPTGTGRGDPGYTLRATSSRAAASSTRRASWPWPTRARHQRQPVLHHHLDARTTSTASTPSSARSSPATTWSRRSPRCRREGSRPADAGEPRRRSTVSDKAPRSP